MGSLPCSDPVMDSSFDRTLVSQLHDRLRRPPNLLQIVVGPRQVTYWRERGNEVDYVVRGGDDLWAIEVKSGRQGRLSGLAAFMRRYPKAVPLVVGSGGISLEELFDTDPAEILGP